MKIRIVNSNFSLVHPIQKELYKKNIDIAGAFKDIYGFFNSMPIPDEVEPMIPRIIMQSNEGHSQITFALNNINLTTSYSGDYIDNYSKCSEYMLARTNKIFNVINKIGLEKVLYISLKTRIMLPMDSNCNPTQYLLNKLNKNQIIDNKLTDIQERYSFVKDNRYFVNISLGNYSQYDEKANLNPDDLLLQDFRNSNLSERGITIDFEMNNRYYYNYLGEIDFDDILKDKQYIYDYTYNFINNDLIDLVEKGVFNI